MRQRRTGSTRSKNTKPMTPPIITTTAATPQDSPSTTLAPGASFSEWEKCQSIPSLLKPPVVIGSVKALNNLTSEQMQHQTKSDTIYNKSVVDTILEVPTFDKLDVVNSKSVPGTSEMKPQSTSTTKQSNIKKVTKSSLKKKKDRIRSESEGEVLNNHRTDSIANLEQDKGYKPTKRIQNNTKNTNKISPHTAPPISKLEVQLITNTQKFYEGLGQPTPQQVFRRRMSTMDQQVFHKVTNIDLQNMRNFNARQHRASLKLSQHQQRHHYQPESNKSLSSEKEDTPEVCTVEPEPFKFTIESIRKRIEGYTYEREDYSLYLFAEDNKFRQICVWFVTQKWFDNVILLFIALNCITLAMERPNIPPNCPERYFLMTANYIFTVVFTVEMFVKVKWLPLAKLRYSFQIVNICFLFFFYLLITGGCGWYVQWARGILQFRLEYYGWFFGDNINN